MPWYFYHPETRELLRESDRNPKKLPNATKTRPRTDIWGMRSEVETQVYDPEKDVWEAVPDYRREYVDEKGKVHARRFQGYYMPELGDTPGSKPRFNEKLGPLPEGAELFLPSFDGMRDEIFKGESKAYEKAITEILRCDEGIEILIRLNYVTRAAGGDLGASRLLALEFGEAARAGEILARLDQAREDMITIQARIKNIGENSYLEMWREWKAFQKRRGKGEI